MTADLASPKTLRALSYLQPISCRHQKTTVPYGKALERKNYRSKKKLLLLHYLRATVRLCPCHLTTPPATYRVGGGGGLGWVAETGAPSGHLPPWSESVAILCALPSISTLPPKPLGRASSNARQTTSLTNCPSICLTKSS